MFDRPGVFYFFDPQTIFDDNWILDQKKVDVLRQHNFVIADFSSEHYGIGGLIYIYDFLQENGLNFILLSHEPSDHQILPRMFFYPYWYYFGIEIFERVSIESARQYKLGCLNGVARPHRIANWLLLKDHPQKDQILINICNNHTTRSDDINLTDNELQRWRSVGPDLPLLKEKSHSIQLSELTNSYVHLVTETTVIPGFFISEKTWKPIAAGNLFLIFGNRGSIKYLRDQGVDVFDDIIDHSYDAELDWRKRMEKLHKTIDILLQKNLEKIFEDTSERRKLNQIKFFNGEFDRIYRKTIISYLDKNVPVC